MKAPLRIAIAQVNATVGDINRNSSKVIDFIGKATSKQADLVVFPELVLCGYPPEDLLFKDDFVRYNLRALERVIKKTSRITAVVGFVHRDKKGAIYNAAGVIQGQKLKGVYCKENLPNYGIFDEKRYFQKGHENKIFESEKTIFGITICEDIWVPKGPFKAQADAGAKLLLNLSASPYHAGKVEERVEILSEQARNCKAFLCYVNLVGGQDELVFDGSSILLDREGKIIASGKHFEEDLVFADIDLHYSKRRKPLGGRVIKYIHLSSIRKKKRKLALEPCSVKRLTKVEEVYKALVLGTQDYIKKNGFHKVVIGISGGIDSALTAVIACDAVGMENVIGITMPSRYSSGETKSDAKTLASNLGIRLITTPIETVYKAYLAVFIKEFKGIPVDSTEENIQARIRGNILMAFSNKFGWLVLTTGNKSETSVGYCTLYGDMAGGFAILKDVPKTLVYKLAEWRNKQSKKERLIPEGILRRAPSAELREGQKDVDALPPYHILDAILRAYVEKDKSFKEIAAAKFKPSVVRRVISMVDRNEYKRRQAPPGVKITPKAFGKDRRFPITNRFKEY